MRIQQIKHLTLFKFTDELGDRLQTLLDKKKADTLTATENLELEAIGVILRLREITLLIKCRL